MDSVVEDPAQQSLILRYLELNNRLEKAFSGEDEDGPSMLLEECDTLWDDMTVDTQVLVRAYYSQLKSSSGNGA